VGRRFCECPRTEVLGGDNILRTGAPPGVQITPTPCQLSPIQQAAGFYSRNYPELTFGSPYRLPHLNFQKRACWASCVASSPELRNESAKMKLWSLLWCTFLRLRKTGRGLGMARIAVGAARSVGNRASIGGGALLTARYSGVTIPLGQIGQSPHRFSIILEINDRMANYSIQRQYSLPLQ